MNTIIYTRYSSDMQRTDSCIDQERKIREELDRLGIDHRQATVIRDEGISGTKENRPGFGEIRRRIQTGEKILLAVDDQSRLSRGDLVKAFIMDLVFADGRFISTGDGIDTDKAGWEVHVGIGQIHNALTIADLGRRVRRGQEGRIRDGNGSAGDICYGYQTEYAPGEKIDRSGRGPKPKRIVIINPEEQRWVHRIFAWFIEGKSLGWIARELTRLGAPKGNKSTRPGWHHQQVRRVLSNGKYIGDWQWGKTIIKRDGQGRKKQVPVDVNQVTTVSRPKLRIIDDNTWQAAQKRLANLNSVYGPKMGQRPRGPRHHGPKYHYTVDYPTSLLGGLLYCGKCGSRFSQQTGGKDLYYGCSKHRRGLCDLVVRVPQSRGEKAILQALNEYLSAQDDWIPLVLSALHKHWDHLLAVVPQELDEALARQQQLQKELGNLVTFVRQGGSNFESLSGELRRLEDEKQVTDKRVNELQQRHKQIRPCLDRTDVESKLKDLQPILRGNMEQAALALREIIGKVTVEEVIPKGKRRGYPVLDFSVYGIKATLLMAKNGLDSHLIETNSVAGKYRIDLKRIA